MKFRHNGRLNRQWHRILGVYLHNFRTYSPPVAWWKAWAKSVKARPGKHALDRRYVLVDGRPVLCRSLILWGSWFDRASDRVVARTELDNRMLVSTVFLGLDHRMFGEGPPILWETMTFDDLEFNGGDYQMRYSTEEAAREGHEVAVAVASLRLPAVPTVD